MAPRTACLWCPDWPVVAAREAGRVASGAPVVVLGRDGRVRAASHDARARGVKRGMRRRDAEAACPAAEVIDAEPVEEARVFEAVARALDDVTPRVAIGRPGLLSFPADGPARYFGGEEALVERIRRLVHAPGARLGVADGVFAAELAARAGGETAALVVPAGHTPEFLAPHPVDVLVERGMGELAGLLVRLGIRTLGELASLPAASVAARFGEEGTAAHRLARGDDHQPPLLTEPPPELAETAELDPPADRVDVAAFAAKGLADRLLDRLDRWGLACTRVVVEAQTEHGEALARTWRHDGPFTASALAQRVRWQLDAWLTGGGVTAGLTLLRLVPEEVVPLHGRQLGFWGGDPLAAERADRVLARLQGMLGREAVLVPVVRGGRTPTEQVAWVPWGEPRELGCKRSAMHPANSQEREVWPGAVPPPAPARVYDPPVPATLVDADGDPVAVSARGVLRAPPAHLTCDVPGVGGAVEAWAGPWLHDTRWWDDGTRRRCALFQVVAGGVACLVTLEGGRAGVEAVYD